MHNVLFLEYFLKSLILLIVLLLYCTATTFTVKYHIVAHMGLEIPASIAADY